MNTIKNRAMIIRLSRGSDSTQNTVALGMPALSLL